MVSYQDWTTIAYRIARQKGFEPARPTQARLSSGGRGFGTANANAQLFEVIGDIWNDRKDELQSASESRAEAIAESEIEVSA